MSKRKKPAPSEPAPPVTAEPTAYEPMADDPTAPVEVDYDDHDLLGQADWVIGGDAARKARQQGLYAGYVLFLGALVYGLPIVQAVFRTSDASTLGDQLEPGLPETSMVSTAPLDGHEHGRCEGDGERATVTTRFTRRGRGGI